MLMIVQVFPSAGWSEVKQRTVNETSTTVIWLFIMYFLLVVMLFTQLVVGALHCRCMKLQP